MNNVNVKNIVNESINNVLKERKKNMIKQIIKEEVRKAINEEEDNKQKKQSVMSSLKKPGVKFSELAYKLWGDTMDPDTARSLFSRKMKDDEWHFSSKEINSLYYMINQI